MKFIKEKQTDVIVKTVYDDASDPQFKALQEAGLFKGGANETYAMLDAQGKGVIYYGLGAQAEMNPYHATHYYHDLGRYLQKKHIHAIHLEIPKHVEQDAELSAKVFEGLYQAEYQFDKYQTEAKEQPELAVSVDNPALAKPFDTVEKVIKGIFLARDLVNEPANVLYPESYAERIGNIFAGTAVEVEVYDRKQIEALGMEAYLAVNRGSNREPRLIVMKYLPLDQEEHITLVGKGMTYDSGGYALKPANSMITMKCDMAGSAAVVGALYALQANQVQQNVVGVIAAAENMIDGKAFKNGDIIGSMKGTTIEVNNTDAEGRLTLADAIYYAATQLNSTAIVDLATLTGAAIVSLGQHTSALMANDEDLAQAILTGSQQGCEQTYRLVGFPDHYQQIKGKFADLDNAPKGGAGTITAGLFLEHFAEDLPWAHLDIAGPAFLDAPRDHLPAGATGVGVKTLYRWIAAI